MTGAGKFTVKVIHSVAGKPGSSMLAVGLSPSHIWAMGLLEDHASMIVGIHNSKNPRDQG